MLKYDKIGKKTYRIYVNRGYGLSAGNLIDGVAEVPLPTSWIEVEKKGGYFYLVNENLTKKKGNWIKDNTDLGFASWDDTVQNIDYENSDEAQCFDMSRRLKWQEVIMTTKSFQAKTIERLCEALEHVVFTAWCPGDI